MVDISYEIPLKAPEGTALTPKSMRRYDSGFPPTLSLDEALQYLEEECRQIPSVESVKMHSNYDRINVPKLRKMIDEDPAVCLELKLQGKAYFIVCHQWGMIEHNIYALHLALRAMLNIVKWGVADLETALYGFASERSRVFTEEAEDESLMSKDKWMTILRLDASATLEEANKSYRHHVKVAAENEEALLRLNQAIEAARKYYAKFR